LVKTKTKTKTLYVVLEAPIVTKMLVSRPRITDSKLSRHQCRVQFVQLAETILALSSPCIIDRGMGLKEKGHTMTGRAL